MPWSCLWLSSKPQTYPKNLSLYHLVLLVKVQTLRPMGGLLPSSFRGQASGVKGARRALSEPGVRGDAEGPSAEDTPLPLACCLALALIGGFAFGLSPTPGGQGQRQASAHSAQRFVL